MKTAIVLTTINVPSVIEEIAKNASYHGRDVEFIIIGDRKTPDLTDHIRKWNREWGYEILNYDVDAQKKEFPSLYPKLYKFIPYDCVERRNFGYLIAAERGADVIVSMDDDNFPISEIDFISEHGVVGNQVSGTQMDSSDNWVNLMALMLTDPPGEFYMRGFPISKRWNENRSITETSVTKKVMVNGGLWLNDPDVDTFTWVCRPFKIKRAPSQILVGDGIWSPFNSQNTAFHRDLLPCFYLITFSSGMDILAGNNSFRFDDIWMSYFCQKVMHRMGDFVKYGFPYVVQNRNQHNYIHDMKREMMGLEMTDKVIEALNSFTLSSTSYLEGYKELIKGLKDATGLFSEVERLQLENMLEGMQIWTETVEQL